MKMYKGQYGDGTEPTCPDCGIALTNCENDEQWCCACGHPRAWCGCEYKPAPSKGGGEDGREAKE